jgi:hypothetical protein
MNPHEDIFLVKSPLLGYATIENAVFFTSSDPSKAEERCYEIRLEETRVEASSKTFTVTLRVVGRDDKRSLKSQSVKYGHESNGTQTRERLH